MEFDLDHISKKYIEIKVDELSSGVLDTQEAMGLLMEMLGIVEDALYCLGDRHNSDRVGLIVEDIWETFFIEGE